MSNFLIVPIRVDALRLTQDQPVAGAMADFSRLPHWVKSAGTEDYTDYNSDVPFLSESILSQPFEGQGLYLQKGVHLHWALPDTLTRARDKADGKIDMPAAPNRWLVTRTIGTDKKQWVVESDYVHPPGETNDGRSIVYPAFQKNSDETDSAALTRSGFVPWRCLGRATELTTTTSWQPASTDSYLPGFNQTKLHALGWGDPNFAAFYPNCHSVFGFHDEGEPATAKIIYEVIGWHADAKDDILHADSAFLQDAMKAVRARYQGADGTARYPGSDGSDGAALTPADIWQKALEQQLKWKVGPDAVPGEATAPFSGSQATGTLYYGKLTIPANSSSSSPPPVRVEFALGNTGTEALSAWLARQQPVIDANKDIKNSQQQALTPPQIEDRLEAIQLVSQLSGVTLDGGFKFREARHEKGFAAVRSGQLWTVRPLADPTRLVLWKKRGDGHAPGVPAGEGVTLPEDLAHQLNALNDLQRKLDRLREQQVSLQRRLYADWCLYQMACYPPEDERESFPEPEWMKYFMKQGLLAREVDAHEFMISGVGKKLATASQELAKSLPAGYELKTRPGPRFWRPADPVVLMAGQGIESTPRHGEDGVLPCFVLTTNSGTGLDAAKAALSALQQQPTDAAQQPTLKRASTTWAHPWHPYLLEWEAEILPVPKLDNLDHKTRTYQPNHVTDNFALPDDSRNGSDLVLKPGHADRQSAATLCSGRCILTPNASRACARQLALWLQKHADPKRLPDRQQLTDWASKNTTDTGRQALAARLNDGVSLSEAQRDWIELLGWTDIDIDQTQFTHDQKTWGHLHSTTDAKTVTFGIPDVEPLTVPPALTDGDPELKDRTQDQQQKLIRERQRKIAKVQARQKTLSQEHTRRQADFDSMKAALEFLHDYPGTIQSQSLGGFHESLLGQEQVFQLPLADPLGFPDMQEFVGPVSKAVGKYNRTAPLPLNDFLPLRTGFMKLLKLRIVDTFGQVQDLLKQGDKVAFANASSLPGDTSEAWLPPRFSQAARVNFRWLSAGWEDVEMNAHPATSPICGWLLPNNLDHTLQVHAADGSVLGILCEQDVVETSGNGSAKSNVVWQPRPGNGPPVYPDNLPNARLQDVVRWIMEKGAGNTKPKYSASPPPKNETATKGTFLQRFLLALDSAQQNIHPAEFKAHESLALLMGRPIAVVRAAVSLAVQGLPAANHSWSACRRDLHRAELAEQALASFDQAATRLSNAGDSLRAAPSDAGYKDLPTVAKDLSSIAQQLLDAASWLVEAGVPAEQTTEFVIQAITPVDLDDKGTADWSINPAESLAAAGFNLDQLRTVTGNLEAVRTDLHRTADAIFAGLDRTRDGFDAVEFPLRIGEFQQLNDGLCGYWIESATGSDWRDDTFYAAQATTENSDNLKTHKDPLKDPDDSDRAFHIPLSLADDPVNLTMLIDPRGVVHATSGVLPTKAISIPPDQYAAALKAIQVFFLSTPVLTPQNKITLPLPREEGFSWAWLTRVQGTQWLQTTDIAQPPADARHTGQQAIVEGWLRLDPQKPDTETT